MKSLFTNYKCPNCENGVVVYKLSGKGENLKAEVKNCNRCFKNFGIKDVQYLKEIKHENNHPTTIEPS